MTLDEILTSVARVYELDPIIKTRQTEYVQARATYYVIARKFTEHGLETIAKKINRHHATVLHTLKVYDDVYSKDNAFNENMERVFFDLKIAEQKATQDMPELRDDVKYFIELVKGLDKDKIKYLSDLVKVKVKTWNYGN